MKLHSVSLAMGFTFLALGALAGCSRPAGNGASATADTGAQPSFATPEEAATALIQTVQQADAPALQKLLGPGTAELVSSGDPVADQKERETFLERYRAYHEFAAGDPNDLVLMVGEDRWPLPIPLVRRDQRWQFDGEAGTQEILLRRIGANELRTINVMRGYVEAQNLYAGSAHDGSAAGAYAQKLRSDAGKQNGLYWEVAAGADPSPAGPLLAEADAEGYGGSQAKALPYHGYLFRLLTSQGAAAQGGARSYLTDGKLTGGFALLAYPASYGASGIMTFMINQDGIVWQRDLGADTAKAAAAIDQFNPDDSWTPLAREVVMVALGGPS
ncbi:MAG TPA: DUF2950 domain-containing protein [Acetobacteraceae bacterium]|nr:DUF2950 domain-containing protein [Acetobacteraceae bacterium]